MYTKNAKKNHGSTFLSLDPYVCLWSWLFCFCLYLDFCINVVVLSQLWYAIAVHMIDFDCQQVKSIGTLFESDYLLSFCLFMYLCVCLTKGFDRILATFTFLNKGRLTVCRSFFYFLMILFDLAPGQEMFGCAYLDPSFIWLWLYHGIP